MSDFEAPRWADSMYVTVNGRRLLRVMGGDGTAVDEPDTPAPESAPTEPSEGHAQTDLSVIDYEQRYNQLRPKFDQTAQEAAEYRQIVEGLTNPETRAQALAQFGIELEEGELEPEYDLDELAALREEIEGLKTHQLQASQQAQAEADATAQADYVADQIDELQEKFGELDEGEVHIVVARAFQLPDENGQPDIQAAWQQLTGLYDKRLQTWAKSKKTAARVADGQSASKQYDTSTREGRLDAAMARLNTFEQA